MNLTGYVVRVSLSAAGQRELGEVLDRAEDFEALVVDDDPAGLWVSNLAEGTTLQGTKIMLLKWEHFSTVVFDYEPQAPMERPRAGFQPR